MAPNTFNMGDFNPRDLLPKDLMPKDLRQKVYDHMGVDPSTLPIVSEQFDKYNHPNLQIALNEICDGKDNQVTVLGIQSGFVNNITGTSLKDIISPQSFASMVGLGGVKEGSVQYLNMDIGNGQKLACVQGALYLVAEKGKDNIVVLLRQNSMMDFAGQSAINLDVMAKERATAESFVQSIQKSIRKKNIYRGKILSTSQEGGGLKFHDLPPVTRNRIILPDGLLKRIERQTIEAGKHSEALKKAKRKLKRGILLHGKPGTGKTLTAMYLASEMKERTVILMTGRGQGSIESSCRFARWLEPSMVVIEDVDLIAEDRTKQQGCNTAILLELLNEMDGLSDDVDVLFFLTTNRPDVLEPALAARPGRVDQAYEIPLPDRECRNRLFELYIEGMEVEVEDMEPYIKRTQGASGAFIAEIMRKAALFAAADGEPIVVKDNHMDEAMHELLVVGGTLTKSLLGSGEIGFTPTGFKDS